jgi:LysR family transcriptional activator of nhaA
MEWLNYHHLLYFYVVAREGGITQAARVLRLAHPTLSGQIRQLEDALGEKLFDRTGRRLVLTEVGRTAYRYADEIFSLGREMLDTVKGRDTGRPVQLRVGIVDVLPKLVAKRLLEPALRTQQSVRLVCLEDRYDRLLAALAVHDVDVILTDAPPAPGLGVRAYGRLVGDCGLSFFGTPALRQKHHGHFPQCLDGAPFLMPSEGSVLRRSLEQWFQAQGLHPRVVAEFEDAALLKVFGQDGLGMFASASIVEREVKKQYGVQVVGRTQEIRERFYAISGERRLRNPAVLAICEAAAIR